MRRRLPILTRILASPAKRDGGFGLVWVTITIAYHVSDLSLGRPRETFTNLYHRGQGLGIDLSVGAVRWLGNVVKVIEGYNGGEPTEPSGLVARSTRHRKDFFHQAGRLINEHAWW